MPPSRTLVWQEWTFDLKHIPWVTFFCQYNMMMCFVNAAIENHTFYKNIKGAVKIKTGKNSGNVLEINPNFDL